MMVTLWKEGCIRQAGQAKSCPCIAVPMLPVTMEGGGVQGMSHDMRVVACRRNPTSVVVDANNHYRPP
eukprot:1468370-Amphidinium_carterae.1